MKLLNVGCGGTRPQEEHWWNLDNLRTQLPVGSPARISLDSEPRYVEHDLSNAMPFQDNEFDGLALYHCLEHFPTQEGIRLMMDCKRVLKPGGIMTVSVPDASYFRKVYQEDRNENWPRLFGVTDPANPIPTFFEAALFYSQHCVLFTEDSLWAYFIRSGFNEPNTGTCHQLGPVFELLKQQLNRIEFSLIMTSTKP